MPHVKYFWDEIEDNVVREYDEDNNTVAHYTTEPTRYGSVLSQDRSGETRHYHFDGPGNTTELTDHSGNVTDTRRYSAFGEETSSTGSSAIAYQFGARHGYQRDSPISCVSIRRRMYSSASARWLSVDPPNEWTTVDHAYAFARNSPQYVDPSGRLCFSDSEKFFKTTCEDNPVFLWKWTVNWRDLGDKNGFIIQRIERRYRIEECNGFWAEVSTDECPIMSRRITLSKGDQSPTAKPQVYWELWTIIRGKGFTGKPPFMGDGQDPPFDSWSLENPFSFGRIAWGSHGIDHMKGKAVFVEIPGDAAAYRKGSAAPPLGWPKWEVTDGPAGTLASICGDDNIELSNLIKEYAREAKTRWDCCWCPDENIVETRIQGSKRCKEAASK